MKSDSETERNHAIVIGGSLAGLLAARALSNHYREVTIIERDVLPNEAKQRRGVPQGHHSHGLLGGGREALEKLLPGISQALLNKGAVAGDLVRDCRWFFAGDCLSRPASGLSGLLVTRPLLEAAVRERVLALANVRTRDNATVDGLLVNDRSDRVAGVRLRNDKIMGDLVVDATGRGSHSPQWLEEMGYARPKQDVVRIALGYTTRFFRRRQHDLNGDLAVVIPPTPDGKRGGVMAAQEGDRWTVTMISHFGACAPEDLNGFVRFAKTLPAPYIHEVVRDAEPLGDAGHGQVSVERPTPL